MKKSFISGLALAATMAGAMATSGTAMAAFADIESGAICHNYYGSEATYFDFYNGGISNWSGVSRSVTCPLVVSHTPGVTAGTVRVRHDANSIFNCWLYAYRADGSQLYFKKGVAVPGLTMTFLNVPVGTYASYKLDCALPGDGSSIYAIEPTF